MSEDAVRKFLLDFKRAATNSGGIILIPRHDTKLTLQYLGLTKRNLEEVLLGLTILNYCAGPKDDRDKPGELWEFGKTINGEDVYIKLKVTEIDGQSMAKCISFHIAKYPLKFPYNNNAAGN